MGEHIFLSEGRCHASECACTDGIDEEHEDERKVDLRIFGFPCIVLLLVSIGRYKCVVKVLRARRGIESTVDLC